MTLASRLWGLLVDVDADSQSECGEVNQMKPVSRFWNYSSEDYEQRQLQLEKDTVARFVRGNVAASNGHYMTRAELEQKRDEIQRDLKES